MSFRLIFLAKILLANNKRPDWLKYLHQFSEFDEDILFCPKEFTGDFQFINQ